MARAGYRQDMYHLPREGPIKAIQEIRDFCVDIYTHVFPKRMGLKYRIKEKRLSRRFAPVIGEVILIYSTQCITFFKRNFIKDYKEWRKESNKAVMDYMEKIAKHILANNTGSAAVFLLASMVLELVQFVDYQGCSKTIKYGSCMYLSYILEKYCMTEWSDSLKYLNFGKIASAFHEKYFNAMEQNQGGMPIPREMTDWERHDEPKLPEEWFEVLSPCFSAQPILYCTVLGKVPTYEVSKYRAELERKFPTVVVPESSERGQKVKLASAKYIEASFEAGDSVGELREKKVKFSVGDKFVKQLIKSPAKYREKLLELCAEIPSDISNPKSRRKKKRKPELPIYLLRRVRELISVIEAAHNYSSKFFLDILEPCRSFLTESTVDQMEIISALSRQAPELFLRIVTNAISLCHRLYYMPKDAQSRKKIASVQNVFFELIFDYRDTEMYYFRPAKRSEYMFRKITKKVMMCYYSLCYLHLWEITIDNIIKEHILDMNLSHNIPPDLAHYPGTSSDELP